MRKTLLWMTACAVIFPSSSLASMACSERADVVAQLGTKYQEAPVALGLANNGGLVEVLTSGDGSTWTIILSMPNGTSCLVAAGESWQPVERELAEGPGI